MKRVIFNGQTGGLGQFMEPALKKINFPLHILHSRLGETAAIEKDLAALETTQDDQVTLLPLAALVPVGLCEKEPDRAFKTNVTDTANLVSQFLTWGERRRINTRVLYVSTGHVYAPKKIGERLSETDPVQPRSIYAKSKLEAEKKITSLMQRTAPNNLTIVRVFGLLSVNQPSSYVLPALINRIKDKNFLNIGGLDCVRDYLDARDVCRIIADLCRRDWPKNSADPQTVTNVCSGEGTSIRNLFETILQCAGISLKEISNQMTESPPRADDIPWMVGDPTRLVKLTGSTPQTISTRSTIEEAFRHA